MKKKSSSLPNYRKISPKKLNETTSSRASVGYKKLSVLTANQSIMFGTERRFKLSNPELTTNTKGFRKTRANQIRAKRIFNKSQLSTIL